MFGEKVNLRWPYKLDDFITCYDSIVSDKMGKYVNETSQSEQERQYRTFGLVAEKLMIAQLKGEKSIQIIRSIDESLNHLRGKGDVSINNGAFDFKCACKKPLKVEPPNASIPIPNTDKKREHYKHKLFLLCEILLDKDEILCWGICDWEFASDPRNHFTKPEWSYIVVNRFK